MRRQEIIDQAPGGPDLSGCQARTVSLTCSHRELRQRPRRGVGAGLREAEIIPRSLERLGMYQDMGTAKLDVSELSPGEAAERIVGTE